MSEAIERAKRGLEYARRNPDAIDIDDAYRDINEGLDSLAASLRAAEEALREIEEHPVRAVDDPCDWHCTRKLTDLAHAALKSIEETE